MTTIKTDNNKVYHHIISLLENSPDEWRVLRPNINVKQFIHLEDDNSITVILDKTSSVPKIFVNETRIIMKALTTEEVENLTIKLNRLTERSENNNVINLMEKLHGKKF